MLVDYKDLGNRIRKKREKCGMSQAELAAKAQLSTQHISNVENARSKVGLEKLIVISNVLNCSLDRSLGFASTPTDCAPYSGSLSLRLRVS